MCAVEVVGSVLAFRAPCFAAVMVDHGRGKIEFHYAAGLRVFRFVRCFRILFAS